MFSRLPVLVAAALLAGLGYAVLASGPSGPAVERASGQTDIAVTPAQLRINQRISQAAVRRANANEMSIRRLGQRMSALEARPPTPGPQGPQGPPGPAAGLRDVYLGGFGTATIGPGGVGTASASCDPGDHPVSVSFNDFGHQTIITGISVFPNLNQVSARFENVTSFTAFVSINAICAGRV